MKTYKCSIQYQNGTFQQVVIEIINGYVASVTLVDTDKNVEYMYSYQNGIYKLFNNKTLVFSKNRDFMGFRNLLDAYKKLYNEQRLAELCRRKVQLT